MKEEIGIYIHIPFCKQKCYYCDFISFAKNDKLQHQYIQVLKKEIQENKQLAIGYKVTSIYIGGGTPSYISSKQIVEILNEIKQNYEIDKIAEITIEVNPGTITKEKLEDYHKCGINRISMGLQTTNDQLLKQIGRIHTYEEFLKNYHLAREYGFCNINVDLMLALPNQTKEILQESLEEVIHLNPEHISMYSLILEEGTVLEDFVKQGKCKLIQDKIERQMYWKAKEMLEQNGYIHYEVSNFSKPEKQSKHNCNCWEQKQYLGFGVSAHSYYHKTRYSNTEDLKQYICSGIVSTNNIKIVHEVQSLADEQKEYMMLGLRKIKGVSLSSFKNKFIQNPIYLFRKELDKLVKQQLIEIDMDNIRLTKKGIDLANLVWEEFV